MLVGSDDWREAHPIGDNFTVALENLEPGTTYEVQSVSISDSETGKRVTPSETVLITTAGEGSSSLRIFIRLTSKPSVIF